MSPALDALEADLLGEKVKHGGHPVLAMCAANAVSVPDPAGNRKLDKSKRLAALTAWWRWQWRKGLKLWRTRLNRPPPRGCGSHECDWLA
jgi:hypothetical protein